MASSTPPPDSPLSSANSSQFDLSNPRRRGAWSYLGHRITSLFTLCHSHRSQEISLRDRVTPLSSEEDLALAVIQELSIHVLKEGESHLDVHHLMKTSSEHGPIDPSHLSWFLNQAIVLEYLDKTDPIIKDRLSLIALQAYSKAASYEALHIQTSPISEEAAQYHRSTDSEILKAFNKDFSESMGVKPHEMFVVDGLLFKEVLDREFYSKDIDSLEDFESWTQLVLKEYSEGVFPKHRTILDISKLAMGKDPQEIKVFAQALEKYFLKSLEEYIADHPGCDTEAIINKLTSELNILSFCTYKDETTIIIPKFLSPSTRHSKATNNLLSTPTSHSKHTILIRRLSTCIKKSGFRVSVDHAKQIWLKVKDIHTIFREQKLPIASLATRERSIPVVYEDYNKFFSQPIVGKFLDLSSDKKKAPYITVMAKATVDLLKGFEKTTVDAFFKEHGLFDLLQTLYFRIHNAMATAILHQDDQIKFINEIELIHQEIQNILAIMEPYDEKAFSESVISRLTSDDPPLIPKDLENPKVHLNASGMHAFSSILSSVEEEKGSKNLNVAILNDTYFEAAESLERAKNYKIFELDGDRFNANGLEDAFNTPPESIDLFLCEFHHNISATRVSYTKENILKQIKAMYEKGLLAKKCTIAIDTTINLEKSPDFQELLGDPIIKALIKTGALNIVLFRSAQKFDMLGIDNYSGGISITVNKSASFANFNARMENPSDQLKRLSYQGLTHLSLYGSDAVEAYRKAIMTNLQFLYKHLPPDAIYRKGSTNPMQISEVKDTELVFLDIKIPENPKMYLSFLEAFEEFSIKAKLTLTSRASFGFIFNNLVGIGKNKLRFTPGLDSETSLSKYATFFNVVHFAITNVISANPTLSGASLDRALSSAIDSLNISAIVPP